MDTMDHQKEAALSEAVARGSSAAVRDLLSAGADANALEDGKTMLHIAVRRLHQGTELASEDPAVVRELLAAGTDVHASYMQPSQYEHSRAALHAAACAVGTGEDAACIDRGRRSVYCISSAATDRCRCRCECGWAKAADAFAPSSHSLAAYSAAVGIYAGRVVECCEPHFGCPRGSSDSLDSQSNPAAASSRGRRAGG